MLDIKSFFQEALKSGQDFISVDPRCDDDVRAQRFEIGRDGPNVEIVDGLHTRNRRHGIPDFQDAEMGRHRLHQNVHRLGQERPGAREYEEPNTGVDERIDREPTRPSDDDRSDDDAHRADGIAEHLQVSAFYIEA